MIYSKFNKFYHFFFKNTKISNDGKYNDNDIYYYHPYYRTSENTSLNDAFDDSQWDHMKNNKSTKLLYECAAETIDEFLINDIISIIEKKQISPRQIYMIVIDEIHRIFIYEQFKKLNLECIHVGVYNFLLDKVRIPAMDLSEDNRKKFSSLSRNYRNWRLHIYAELVDRRLIDDFNYSFYNIDPYGSKKTSISRNQMIIDLEKNNFTKINKRVVKWMKNIPYELSDNVYNKWSDVTYNCILSSDFHLLIETHYDTFKDVKPTFVTEKTYKVIACGRPFIVFSTPTFLKDLRDIHGFKTFSPWIDESYDLEFDDHQRLEMIASEIERIIKLPQHQYDKILNECRRISLENLEIFKKITQDKKEYHKDFEFLKEQISVPNNIHIF